MIPPDLDDEINDVFLEFLQSSSNQSEIGNPQSHHQPLIDHNDYPSSDSSSQLEGKNDEYKPTLSPKRTRSQNIPRYCYQIGQQCFKKMNIQSQLNYFKIDKDRKRSNLSNIMFFLLKAQSLGKEALQKFQEYFSIIVYQLCQEKGSNISIPANILKIRKHIQFQTIRKYLYLLLKVIGKFMIDGDISTSLRYLYQSTRLDKHAIAVEQMKKEQQKIKNAAFLQNPESLKKQK